MVSEAISDNLVSRNFLEKLHAPLVLHPYTSDTPCKNLDYIGIGLELVCVSMIANKLLANLGLNSRSTCCFWSCTWDKYMHVHPQQSKQPKIEASSWNNNSTNFRKLTSCKKWRTDSYIEPCRPWCNAIAYPFGANCKAKIISQWVCVWTLTFSSHLMTAVTKHFAEWDAMYLLPISSFLISPFLSPTVRVTHHHNRCVRHTWYLISLLFDTMSTGMPCV